MPASLIFPKKPLNWLTEEETLRESGLFFRMWRKPTNVVSSATSPHPFRLLFIIHGFGEHSGRYEHLCHYLQDAVDGIAMLDLYGHGKSPGNRGSCHSSEDWLAGCEQALEHAQIYLKKDGFQVETQLLGHSFGGLLSILLAKRGVLGHMRGVTLSAPLLQLVNKPPYLKVKLGSLIEPLAPQLSLKNEIDPHVVSHDDSVVMHYAEDPLNHDRITPRGFKEMQALMDEARAFEKAFPVPMQLILPGADPLVDERVTFKWFMELDLATRAQRTLHSFPGFRHESLNEINKQIPLYAFETELLKRWSF